MEHKLLFTLTTGIFATMSSLERDRDVTSMTGPVPLSAGELSAVKVRQENSSFSPSVT
jgi:hypothetical protein